METFLFPGGWYVHVLSGRMGDLLASLSLASLSGPFIHFNVSLNERTSDTSKQHQSAAAASKERALPTHFKFGQKKVLEFLQRGEHSCMFFFTQKGMYDLEKGSFSTFLSVE